jgi:hypothetical protein
VSFFGRGIYLIFTKKKNYIINETNTLNANLICKFDLQISKVN